MRKVDACERTVFYIPFFSTFEFDQVENLKRKRGYKRGYSVALLVGLEDNRAVLWQIFSHVAKLYVTMNLDGKRTDYRALYNFHESIVNALRPALNEGARSIVVVSPMKTTYAADFLNHVRIHHAHLIQSKNLDRATFATLVGSADQPHRVAELVKTKEFLELVAETTSHEADDIVLALDKNLYNISGNSAALFSLKEIEDKVYAREEGDNFSTDYLVLTEKYLDNAEDKSRLHRLLQIARNVKIETKIVKAETPAGKRISQFGGIVLFTKATRQRVPKR
jgi:stalled ribosome rescue protein Dom34